MTDVCVLVRLHEVDSADGLTRSMESLLQQQRQPDQVLLVEDCSVRGSLARRARDYEADHPFVDVVRSDTSLNRGRALGRGVRRADTKYVAILDCGDVAVPRRLAVELEVLEETDATVVGGFLEEFSTDPNDPHGLRDVPTASSDVRAFAKVRSPVNNTTACFERRAVLDVGNYRPLGRLEDYDLWIRLLDDGAVIRNVPAVLSRAHVGSNHYERRGGPGYLADELRLLWRFHCAYQFLSLQEVFTATVQRVPLRLLPTPVRAGLYERFLRR